MDNQREITAYHEAGHVALALHFRHDIGAVSIVPKATRAGFALTEGEWSDGSKDAEVVIILFAGHAAALHRFPHIGGPNENGAGADEDHAAELVAASRLNADELRAEAARLVDMNWPAIEDVAAALIEHDTLRSEEADIVFGASTEGYDWREMLVELRRRMSGKQ